MGRIKTTEGAPRGRLAAGKPVHLRHTPPPSSPLASTSEVMPPDPPLTLRGDLDDLSRKRQSIPPRLVLIEPSQEHQTRVRKVARTRGLSMAAFDEADDASEAMGADAPPRAWTSVESGEKLVLECSDLPSGGFFYVLHLNNKDELKVVFPNKKDRDNTTSEAVGSLLVPSAGAPRYLSFETPRGTEVETFYLISSSQRLEAFEGVGTLPDNLRNLTPPVAQAIVTALQHYVTSEPTSNKRARALDTSAFDEPMDVSGATEGVRMGCSRLVLISVAKDI